MCNPILIKSENKPNQTVQIISATLLEKNTKNLKFKEYLLTGWSESNI